MMSPMAGNNTKRRRVSASYLRLCDLLSGALAHVSSFLASPLRALFAVALTCRDVERSSTIVGDQWDALDFGHIEKDLAAKLSDDDIQGVLLCTDAVNNLKKLRLTNCINITGVGLEPLRGSTIIEQIDLSLVEEHESPDLIPEPPISCSEVLPILHSIIERGEDCALKHLQFPKVWRKEPNTESDFHAFLTRCNEFLANRDVSCLKCSCNLPGDNRMLEMGRDGYRCGTQNLYGTQNFTCNDCMKHYCLDCRDNIYDHCMSAMCMKCERHYCFNCSWQGQCTSCRFWFCVDCGDFNDCSRCENNCVCSRCASEEKECSGCGVNDIVCSNCAGDVLRYCEHCNKSYCIDCCASNVYAVQFCDDCEEWLCGRCREDSCKEGTDCTRCCQLVLPAQLLKDKERQRQEMQNEIDELRNENRELKNQISALKKEINELKSDT